MNLTDLQPRRILLVKPSALGDIMHALPVLSALRQRYPAAEIHWLVNRSYMSLLEGHPDLNGTIPFDRDLFRAGFFRGISASGRFIRHLRSMKFDLAIDLQGLLRTGLVSRASGATTRIGLKSAREGAGWFYTHRFDDASIHAVDRYWHVAEALGAGGFEKRFHLPVSAEGKMWAAAMLANYPRPWIVVGVGARWLTKRWPPSHFAALIRRAQQQFDGTAIFIGAPDERPLAEEAAATLAGPFVQCAGTTTLPQMVAILAAADVVIANDTGPLHVAVALGRPVVSPFTCTQVAKTGPYGQLGSAVETTVWCKGSELKQCDRMECMAELTPDRLWPALEEILTPTPHA